MLGEIHLIFEGMHASKAFTFLGMVAGEMINELGDLLETLFAGKTLMTFLFPLTNIPDEGLVFVSVGFKPVLVIWLTLNVFDLFFLQILEFLVYTILEAQEVLSEFVHIDAVLFFDHYLIFIR